MANPTESEIQAAIRQIESRKRYNERKTYLQELGRRFESACLSKKLDVETTLVNLMKK